MFHLGTPFLAITGTADENTEKEISISLNMVDYQRVFVGPNRTNLCFHVEKVKKSLMLSQLDWIVDLVKENGVNTPKVIVFCSTLYAIASVMNYLMMQLGNNAFHPTTSRDRKHCLLGIFHSATLPKYKEKLLQCFKDIDGSIRVTIALIALSMGLTSPILDMWSCGGPPRSILDFHQEAGRAGRDNKSADVIVYYYGQQIVHCDEGMRSFLKCESCYRTASYSLLDSNVVSLIPAHDCCQFCAKSCKCSNISCEQPIKPFQRDCTVREDHHPSRVVSESEKCELQSALEELKITITKNPDKSAFGTTFSQGFSSELISDVVEHSSRIFSLEDILTHTPVFNLDHAIQIFEVIVEMFDDIDEYHLMNNAHNQKDQRLSFICIDELLNVDYDSSDMDTFPDPDL